MMSRLNLSILGALAVNAACWLAIVGAFGVLLR